MGGVDNYLLNTRTDLLGHEGMKLRIMVRERRKQLIAQGKQVPSTAVKAGEAEAASEVPPPPTESVQVDTETTPAL